MSDRVLDASEAAAFLRLSRATVLRRAREGSLPARKLGNRWLFSEAMLVDFVAAGQAPKGRDEADQMPRPTLRRARESIAINLEARRNAA